MANIGALLKEEISRLARREIRRESSTLKKASTAHRKHIAALKRQLTQLQRQLSQVARRDTKATTVSSAEDSAPDQRFQARGLKTLRARLGLSAADFGKLIGVSGQSVYNWEAKKATPRRSQIAAIAGVRGLGKREAQARLTSATPKPPSKGKRKAPAKGRRKARRAKG
jgi:DNA-binding transcriptional regulator YiaG